MFVQKILITTATLYANGAVHFGHIAGAYLPGDICARYHRLKKRDIIYISGSDEYGIAISLSAELAGRSPQDHVNHFHAVNKALFDKMNISFDHYSRTTWPGHVEATHQYFTDLLANGYIEDKETEQLYSEQEGRFLADRYVIGTCPRCGFDKARGDECTHCGGSFEATDLLNPRSKLTNSPLTLKKTRHWFLRLDLFREKLDAWLDTKNWKPNVINFIKSYIQDLRPRAITRDTSWGIPLPLPNTTGKVLYVWFDAPIGYISATKEWSQLKGDPSAWERYWYDPNTRYIQFVGKDNIPFHAAIFPSMTMGQNRPYKLVDELVANEFYNLEGRQFSKSDGWFIDLEDFLTRYSSDQLRYTIAANAPETADSEFTWKDFQLKCNTDLVGKFGNFIHRTLSFVQLHCGGKIPPMGNLEARDEQFLQDIQQAVDKADGAYEGFRVRAAAAAIMELASLGNVYFDAKKPWNDAKSDETKAKMYTTIACCLECVKALALVSSPIIPEAAGKIWKLIGFEGCPGGWDEVTALKMEAGKTLPAPQVLFSKIEDKQIEMEIAKLMSLSKNEAPAATDPLAEKAVGPDLVTFDEVRKLDLRVAKIIGAEKIAKSKKL
ncbi:MAG: methionine--tRNA ligase, partial [Verrucomicrobia bacterium]|nr:methionine--tRNA ligase [Verrucomicrobiota bacterium]